MNNDSILENLRILKIYKSDQLKNQDLSFWHLKTYKQNISNEEELIIINNAKEELDTLNNEDLRKILDEHTFSKKNDNKPSINDINKNSSNPDARIKQENKLVGIEVFEKAERFFDRKDYQRAVNFYSQLSSSNEFEMLEESKKLRLFNRRGISLRNLKEYDKAILDFNSAIKIDNNQPNLYFNRGKCKYYLEQWESAIIDLNKAISITKVQDPEFYYFRGLSKNGLKQFKDAIEDLTIAIKYEPQREEFKVAKNFAEKKLLKQNTEQEYSKKTFDNSYYKSEDYKKFCEDRTKKYNEYIKEEQKKSNLTYRGLDYELNKEVKKKNHDKFDSLSKSNDETDLGNTLIGCFGIVIGIAIGIAIPPLGVILFVLAVIGLIIDETK